MPPLPRPDGSTGVQHPSLYFVAGHSCRAIGTQQRGTGDWSAGYWRTDVIEIMPFVNSAALLYLDLVIIASNCIAFRHPH